MTPLQADLLGLLDAAATTERDLFATLDPALRDAPGTIGEWSARDLRTHLAAWRAIEARRLDAIAAGAPDDPADPARDADNDVANAAIAAERGAWSWARVADDAGASVEALAAAIARNTNDALCECVGLTAGIGVNGVNHALGHLADVAELGGGHARYDRFLAEVEAILGRSHLLPRDSGLLLYNAACYRALRDQLDDARRLLRIAFRRLPDLRGYALTDPDLAVLRDELAELAAGP